LDGVLLDLGVSSPQLEAADRGFSFMHEGPLDMRMDTSRGLSAADWLATASVEEIECVLREYGEERFARRIAQAVAQHRSSGGTLRTTRDLVRLIDQAMPYKDRHKHPATRTFQGIRIFINRELDDLASMLDSACDLLAAGGRLVVISFHSLEDRVVKRFMKDKSTVAHVPRELPVIPPELRPKMRLVGRAIRPSADEVRTNPRARSAVMRVAERLA
jgi:16S rRNA (cytosine1402-N4)-methyltransferase